MTQEREPSSRAFSAEEIVGTPPFNGDCTGVELTRTVNPSQLSDELSDAAGLQVQVMTMSSHPGPEISPEAPARLYAHPRVDEDLLRRVIDDHDPDDDYGYTPQQREKMALLSKISAGQELSREEVTRALALSLQTS